MSVGINFRQESKLGDVTAIVVSHRGWDGTRILGVFSSKATAVESTKDFNLAENEELIFDFMKFNRVSASCGSTHSGKKIVERHHTYT